MSNPGPSLICRTGAAVVILGCALLPGSAAAQDSAGER